MNHARFLFIVAFILFFTACKCPDNSEDIGFSPVQREWFDSIPLGTSSFEVISSFGVKEKSEVNKEYTTGISYQSRRLKCDQAFDYDNCNVYYSVADYLFIFKLSSEHKPARMEIDFHNFSSSYASFCNLNMNLDNPTEVHSVIYHPFSSLNLPLSIQIPDTIIRSTNFTDLYRVSFDLPSNALPSFVHKVWISRKYGLVAFQSLDEIIWYLKP